MTVLRQHLIIFQYNCSKYRFVSVYYVNSIWMFVLIFLDLGFIMYNSCDVCICQQNVKINSTADGVEALINASTSTVNETDSMSFGLQ